MKRLLSLLFVIAGFAFAQSASAQTSDPGKKKTDNKTDTTKHSTQKKSGPGGTNSGPGGITIDESGAPKAKPKNPAATPSSSTPKETSSSKKDEEQSAQKTSEGSPAPAAPDMAIDESGTSKVRKDKPAALNNGGTSSNIDSAKTSTAKPQ